MFKAALEQVGFHCRLLAARVLVGAPTTPRARTHALLEVDTPQGQYLADVGFGGAGPLHPLPLLPGLVSHQPGSAHRLRHEGGLWVLEGDVGAGWSDLYAFTLEAQLPIDIEMANHFVSTHPSSVFRQIVTAQRVRRTRRAVLRGSTLEVRVNCHSETREINAEEELLPLLAQEFGLVFPPGTRFTAQV
ncbi:hypothetical protein GCM10011611_10600 [Aliidongia dinghuensis]|uniref:Arylamine N-acetyltransferase n=1 Tax=Aliidongia dinghuensis TaxID=1867774 RepID=A0A8J2YQJ1_9PROT|nr:hypothetical protein GCM10011611_10600 [Aliidongia dinghuensis]